MNTVQTDEIKGRLVFNLSKVNSEDVPDGSLIYTFGKTVNINTLNSIKGVQLDVVAPIIVDNAKPLIGDTVTYKNSKFILLSIDEENNKCKLVPKDIEFERPLIAKYNRVYHKVLVDTNELAPKVLGAIKYGKLKEGYTVLVVVDTSITEQNPNIPSFVKGPIRLYLMDGKAIIKSTKGIKRRKVS